MLIETVYKEPVRVKAGDILLTRSGQQAHIVAVNRVAKRKDQCIVGFVNGLLRSWCLNGDYYTAGEESECDLQMPEADLEVRTVTSCIVICESGARIIMNDINAEQARELVDDAVMIHYIEYVVPANQD
jgi:hypothetical protein